MKKHSPNTMFLKFQLLIRKTTCTYMIPKIIKKREIIYGYRKYTITQLTIKNLGSAFSTSPPSSDVRNMLCETYVSLINAQNKTVQMTSGARKTAANQISFNKNTPTIRSWNTNTQTITLKITKKNDMKN